MTSKRFLVAVMVSGLLATIGSARAQSYTVNIVAGWNMIANHFDKGGNTLEEIIPSPADATSFLKLSNTVEGVVFLDFVRYLNNAWQASSTPGAKVLNPGEGAYINATTPFSITFTGTPHTPVLPATIGTNWAVLSRQIAATGTFEQVVGYAPPEGAVVARLIPGPEQPDLGCRAFRTFRFYIFRSGAWVPSEPVLAVGESAWFSTNSDYSFPAIVEQPTNQTVSFCDNNVTMSVTATGRPPFCYQWRLDGADIPGATTNSYTITNATPLQQGGYTVEVGAFVGAVTSQVAQLTVLAPGATPDLSLTPEAQARGFVLSTFAANFPPVPADTFLGGPGPLAAAFLTNGHVLVTHLATGNIYNFPANSDGQDAATVPTNAISGGLAGLAQIPRTNGGFNYYMCIQTGRVYQVNEQGLPVRLITNIDHATGLLAAPANISNPSLAGKLFVSTAGGSQNYIWVVDPLTNFNAIFSTRAADGIAFTQDGTTLLAAAEDQLLGLRISDATTNFQYAVEHTDGIIAAAGTLLGKAYVNCLDGKLWEVDLATGDRTLIARCGTRGDFLYADPFDGSLLITQSDRIKRLRYPGADFFGLPGPGLTITVTGSTINLCWPTTFLGYRLQRTGSLSPPAWTPVTNVVATVGGQSCVGVTFTGSTGFFRLVR